MVCVYRCVYLVLVMSLAGCGFLVSSSGYRQTATAHVVRADGSSIAVLGVSTIKHTISSIGPEPTGESQVTLIWDDRTFVVSAEQISLNGSPYATVPPDAEKILIKVDQGGFQVTADGEPVDRL